MGKGRRAIEKIGKKQELCKAGIVTTRIQQQSHCMPSGWPEAKVEGESNSSMASHGQQAGSRKKSQSQYGRKQQDSGSGPRRVRQHAGIL